MSQSVNGAVVAADLSGAMPADTAVLYTVFPGTNKRTGWNITFAGPGHPKTIAFNNDAERKRLHKAAMIERAQVNGRKWKGDEDKQPDESRRESVESWVARIVSWTPVDFGGGPVEFNEGDATAPTRAVELLMQPKLGAYLLQMVEFMLDEKSFMTDSAQV